VIFVTSWRRWQDWVAVVAGVYAFLSPIWTPTVSKATTTLVILGIVAAVVGLVSLAMPGAVALEWIEVVVGILMFIAPWVIGFTATMGMAWTAWIVGVVLVVVGLLALPQVNRVHRGTLSAQH
jgi:SPW repeat